MKLAKFFKNLNLNTLFLKLGPKTFDSKNLWGFLS